MTSTAVPTADWRGVVYGSGVGALSKAERKVSAKLESRAVPVVPRMLVAIPSTPSSDGAATGTGCLRQHDVRRVEGVKALCG